MRILLYSVKFTLELQFCFLFAQFKFQIHYWIAYLLEIIYWSLKSLKRMDPLALLCFLVVWKILDVKISLHVQTCVSNKPRKKCVSLTSGCCFVVNHSLFRCFSHQPANIFLVKGSCIHKRFKIQSVKTLKWVIMKNLLPLVQSVSRTSIRCGMAGRLKGCRSTLTPRQKTAASPSSSKVDGRTWTWSPHPKRRPSGGSAVWRRSWLAWTASTDCSTANSILERPFLKPALWTHLSALL